MSYQASHHTKDKEVVIIRDLKTEEAYECMLEYAARTHPIYCEERNESYEDGKWGPPQSSNDEWGHHGLTVPTQEDFRTILGTKGEYLLHFNEENYLKISRS